MSAIDFLALMGVVVAYLAALLASLYLLGAVVLLATWVLNKLGFPVGKPSFEHSTGYALAVVVALLFGWAIWTNPVGFFLGGGGRVAEAYSNEE